MDNARIGTARTILWRFRGLLCVGILLTGRYSLAGPVSGPVLVPALSSRPGATTAPVIATRPVGTRPVMTQPAGPTRIRIDEPTFNFGRVWEDTPITHTFSLVNMGGSPLAVLDVHTTCGCTTVGKWDKAIAPGATWHLEVKVRTSGPSGKFSKAVIVQTNDPAQPVIRFSVEGEIRQRFDTKPTRSISFGMTDRVKPSRRSITITNNLEQPAVLSDPTVDNKLLKAQLQEVERGRKYELTVETVPPLPDGPVRGKVTVRTDVKEQPELVINVYGNVQPRVTLQPTMLLVPQPLTLEFRRRITLKVRDAEPIQITDVKPSSDDIHVETEPAAENDGHDIWVTLAPGTVLPPTGRTITISTSDQKVPRLIAVLRPFDARRAINQTPSAQSRQGSGQQRVSVPTRPAATTQTR